MNNRINLQQFKVLLLVKSIIALVLATPDVASTIEVKDTDYPIPADAYFVAPDGNDTNSGKSLHSPWPVEKAIKQAPDGATIVFRGGIYRNVNVGINKKLTLQAYPHEQPWLKGSMEVQDWVADGEIWRKDGWNYSLPVIKETHIDPKYPIARYTDMVYINGVSLKQVGSKASVEPGTFFVDDANNKLYIGNNPVGQIVESTVSSEAFGLWQNHNSKPAGTVIRGLGFVQYALQAINVGAPSVELENNTFAWNGVKGVALHGGNNAIVRGNTFSYNGQSGIGGRADGILLEGNTISFNNVEYFRKTWGAAGVKLFKSNGSVLRDNIVENNYATGIWVDGSSLNTTIANNTSRYNESIGIQYELSHKAYISGNMVHDNGAGIMLADSSDSMVFNNTLMNNKYKEPIIEKDSPRVNEDQAEIAQGIMWITRNNVVKNNTLK